jgi:sporulation protein YlmC with PRC-barrel domain
VNAKDAKKPDPKKDAKAKPNAKGAPPVDDPNSPKDIVIDYPDIPSLPDYIIIDTAYQKMKETAKPTEKVSKTNK